MNYRIYLGLLLFLISHLSPAQIISRYSIKTDSLCTSDNSLLVISADKIPLLSARRPEQISLLHYSPVHKKLQKIAFQIDQKDPQGRYLLNKDNAELFFNANDELVFRKKDLNQRLDATSESLKTRSLIELEIISSSSESTESENKQKWLYIALHADTIQPLAEIKPLLSYEVEQDSVSSAIYKIGFAEQHPFLLDSFQWPLKNQPGWGADITDTMKIRHTGQFLGVDFKRTQDDYYSKLVTVKQGPLRIIRRTENRIKVFWKLKSPALFIDYVMLPDGFIMDTMIDIPFKIGFFFSNLATITTMDWNDSKLSPQLSVQASRDYPQMPINGLTSAGKEAFNQLAGDSFALTSAMGDFKVALDIPDNFPIQSQLYLRDALQEPDPPENYPGQYGNAGFKTTGWENIASQLYHLQFTVCVTAAQK